MAKVLTLDLVKTHLRLTATQTHLDEELEAIRIPSAESQAEAYLDAPLEDYIVEEVAPARLVTAMLYLVSADLEQDPKILELYVQRAHALMFNDRKNLGL